DGDGNRGAAGPIYEGVLAALQSWSGMGGGNFGGGGSAGSGPAHASLRYGHVALRAAHASLRHGYAAIAGGRAMSPEDWKHTSERAGALNALINKAALNAAGGNESEARRIASVMQGVRAGESLHGSQYDVGDIGDGGAYGPWQFNMGKGRFGDAFKRATR